VGPTWQYPWKPATPCRRVRYDTGWGFQAPYPYLYTPWPKHRRFTHTHAVPYALSSGIGQVVFSHLLITGPQQFDRLQTHSNIFRMVPNSFDQARTKVAPLAWTSNVNECPPVHPITPSNITQQSHIVLWAFERLRTQSISFELPWPTSIDFDHRGTFLTFATKPSRTITSHFELVLGKFGLVWFEQLFAKPQTKPFGFSQNLWNWNRNHLKPFGLVQSGQNSVSNGLELYICNFKCIYSFRPLDECCKCFLTVFTNYNYYLI
jgi:hypothetical protein